MPTYYDVYEFTVFMDKYLKEHPEVVKDQQRIWKRYWNPGKADLEEANSTETLSSYTH